MKLKFCACPNVNVVHCNNYLKPSKNKKVQKCFYLHRFLNPFSQLPAVKKDLKNGAARKFSGPSYFATALAHYRTYLQWLWVLHYTANTYSGKTVEVQWNHCGFEKIQWFTTDNASLYFLPVKIVILALFYM